MRKSFDDYTKPDWLAENTHGDIPHDLPVYRIFRVDFLLKDLQNGTNTLVNPCIETQKDDLENPLKNAEFKLDGEKQRLLSNLMSDYYTQSWSLSPIDWGSFGEGADVIRVKCRAGELFDRLMDDSNAHYGLLYHMGRINYEGAAQIRSEVSTSEFDKYLDGAGYGLLRTVLRIRADFRKEEEIRLVYIQSADGDSSKHEKHLVFGNQNQFCAHLFDWKNLIEDYELCPTNRTSGSEIVQSISNISA